MQERIVTIVPRLNEEKLIEELLATNDEMNTAFTRYHRLITFVITYIHLFDLQNNTIVIFLQVLLAIFWSC